MYMDSSAVVENPAARAEAARLGLEYNCDDPALAVPQCFMAAEWNSGWVGELANTILTNLGANVVALTRANFTAASAQMYQGGSSYTRCVWEVNRGMVDLCVGDFWETNERRGIAPFSSNFDLDTMRILTTPLPGAGGASSSFEASQILDIFKPFATGVWALMVGTFLFAGVSMYIVEAGSGNPDYELEDDIEFAPLRYLLGFCKGFYLSCMGLLTAGSAFTVTKWPGRFITLGFSFFVYIAVASYAAKLIDFLVNTNRDPGRISSLSDLVQNGLSICLLEAMKDLVPEVPTSKKVGMDDYGPMLERMYRNSGCSASIIGKTQYLSMIVGQKASFEACTDRRDPLQHTTCIDPSYETETIALGDPLSPHYQKYCSVITVEDSEFTLAIGMSFPVAPGMLDYISSWVVSMRLDNSILTLRDKYVTSQYPAVCDAVEEQGLGLTIEQMAGTYIISAACMLLGVIVFIFQKLLYRNKKPREPDTPIVETEDEPQTKAGGGADGKEVDDEDKKLAVPAPVDAPPAKNNKKFEATVIDALSEKMDQLNERISSLEKAQSKFANGYPSNGPTNGSNTTTNDPAVSGWLSFLHPPPAGMK